MSTLLGWVLAEDDSISTFFCIVLKPDKQYCLPSNN